MDKGPDSLHYELGTLHGPREPRKLEEEQQRATLYCVAGEVLRGIVLVPHESVQAVRFGTETPLESRTVARKLAPLWNG